MLGIVVRRNVYSGVYPAWQVPIAYVYLFLLIGIIPREWKKKTGTGKICRFLPAFFMLLLWRKRRRDFYDAKDTILAVLNTVYPEAVSAQAVP